MNGTSNDPSFPIDNLFIGTIIEVDGTHVIAELDTKISELTRIYGGEIYPIGQFGSIVKIHFGRRIIYGYVGRLRMKSEYDKERGISDIITSNARIIEADLFGEGEWKRSGEDKQELSFIRGVSTFPLPQQKVYLTPSSELKFIYGQGKGATINLGEHVGSGGTQCLADMNELLGKHTAILGSTGSGKSGTVAAVLHSILERGATEGYEKWKPQIVILDPHNEYSSAFVDHERLSTDEQSLKLPYWLFDLQETLALIIGKTEFVATRESNIVKKALLNARKDATFDLGFDPNKLTVDSPIPYSLQKFHDEIQKQKDALGSKDKKRTEPFDKVINKLEVLKNDKRLNFMMEPWSGTDDPFPEIVAQFVGDGKSIRIVDLSGVPNEVAGTASSVIARMLFSFKVWQNQEERENSPILLVCEEAHRYVPNIGEAQYEAAQDAIKRIAKEGRKYGIGMLLVSQRPSEVESTVLSQCNSWIVLRVTNGRDREHVRAILPDSLAGLTKVLSGLGKREAIFVGQAAMLPSRILIRKLEEEQLPRSHDIDFNAGWQKDPIGTELSMKVGNRWRIQQREQ